MVDERHLCAHRGHERSMASAQDSAMSASTAVHNQDNAAMQAAGLRSPRQSSVTGSAGLSATRGSGGT